MIKHAVGVRLTGLRLRDHIVRLLIEYPEIRAVLVEVNQGGALWNDVFANLPNVKIIVHSSTASKETRFAEALDHWQHGRVLCSQRIPVLEEQAIGFPKAANDDVIDAAVAGVQYFLPPERERPVKVRPRTVNYV